MWFTAETTVTSGGLIPDHTATARRTFDSLTA